MWSIPFLTAEPFGRLECHEWRTGAEAADRNAAGVLVAAGRTEEIVTTPDGVKVFVGRAGDPFYLDGTVVTAVLTALRNGAAVDLSAFDPQRASNLFAGTNVTAIVLEVPEELIGSETISLWATTTLDDHPRRLAADQPVRETARQQVVRCHRGRLRPLQRH